MRLLFMPALLGVVLLSTSGCSESDSPAGSGGSAGVAIKW